MIDWKRIDAEAAERFLHGEPLPTPLAPACSRCHTPLPCEGTIIMGDDILCRSCGYEADPAYFESRWGTAAKEKN